MQHHERRQCYNLITIWESEGMSENYVNLTLALNILFKLGA